MAHRLVVPGDLFHLADDLFFHPQRRRDFWGDRTNRNLVAYEVVIQVKHAQIVVGLTVAYIKPHDLLKLFERSLMLGAAVQRNAVVQLSLLVAGVVFDRLPKAFASFRYLARKAEVNGAQKIVSFREIGLSFDGLLKSGHRCQLAVELQEGKA